MTVIHCVCTCIGIEHWYIAQVALVASVALVALVLLNATS